MDLTPPRDGPSPDPAERLESWKEIASYLRRSVSTVQRWERLEGLPVHRHMHGARGTPYAYKGELDAWWANRRPQLEAAAAKDAATRRARRVAVAVAAVAVAGLAVAWVASQRADEASLPFEERDRVLIATFDNRTGEEAFDGALEYALERELSNSRYVNVVPHEQVDDILRLMRRPLDTPLTPEVAREVALRDGGIRLVLTGRIEKLDSTYLLSVSLIDPADARMLAGFREEPSGQAQVVPALRRLSDGVRRGLGESLADIRRDGRRLERVTTPSLAALRLYSEGQAFARRLEWEKAEQLFREALREDPSFALARLGLATSIWYQVRRDDAAPHYQRAFELAPTVATRERLWITAEYWRFERDYEQAAHTYELLLHLYPDDAPAAEGLANVYRHLGKTREIPPLLGRLAEARPNNFRLNVMAASAYEGRPGELDRARLYADRALAVYSEDLRVEFPARAHWLELFEPRQRWRQGDPADLVARLEDGPSAFEPLTDSMLATRAALNIALGRLEAAESLLHGLESPGWQAVRVGLRSQAAYARGRPDQIRDRLADLRAKRPLFPAAARELASGAVLLARAGDTAAAEAILREIDEAVRDSGAPPGLEPDHLQVVRGQVALRRGRAEEGARWLEEALEVGYEIGPAGTYFLVLLELAEARAAEGDLDGAIQWLERVPGDGAKACRRSGVSAPAWQEALLALASLYTQTGRHEEAEREKDKLRRMLAYADEDHWLRRQLDDAPTVRASEGRHGATRR